MRLMTTLAAAAVLATFAKPDDAGAASTAAPPSDAEPPAVPLPETLEAALEALAAVTVERDEALAAGQQAVADLGQTIEGLNARAAAAEKALAAAEKKLSKAPAGVSAAAPAAPALAAAGTGATFEVEVMVGTVNRGPDGVFTKGETFEAFETEREDLTRLRTRGIVAFADAAS